MHHHSPRSGLSVLSDLHLYDSSDLKEIDTLSSPTSSFATSKCMDRRTGSVVIIKRKRLVEDKVARVHAASQDLEQPIVSEMTILELAAIRKNPYVVSLVGFIAEEAEEGISSLGLALEYAQYGTLADYLEYKSEIQSMSDWTRRFQVAGQIAAGLETVHACGVVHGDVKPKNILLFAGANPDSLRAKLASFECSASLNDIQQQAYYAGTEGYLAPEISRNEHSINRDFLFACDTYAFGITLLEIFTALHPQTPSAAGHDLLDVARGLFGGASTDINQKWRELNCLRLANTVAPNPSDRPPMAEIRHTLDAENIYESPTSEKNDSAEGFYEDTENLRLIGAWECKAFAVQELKDTLCDTRNDATRRGEAALELSELCLSGYGFKIDREEAIDYLWRAVNLGNLQAISYFPRIHRAYHNDLPDTYQYEIDARRPEDGHGRGAYADAAEWYNKSYQLEDDLCFDSSEDYCWKRILASNRLHQETEQTVSISFHGEEFFQLPAETDKVLQELKEMSSLKRSPTVFYRMENTKDEKGSLLLLSIQHEWMAITQALLEAGCSIVETDSHGNTPILAACQFAKLGPLEYLIPKLGSPSKRSASLLTESLSPFHFLWTFDEQSIEKAADLLLQSGADINAITPPIRPLEGLLKTFEFSGTPLHAAIAARCLPAVRILRGNGAEMEIVDPHTGTAALQFAVGLHFYEIAKYLLDAGAEMSVETFREISKSTPPFELLFYHGPDYQTAPSETLDVLLSRLRRSDTDPLEISTYLDEGLEFALSAVDERPYLIEAFLSKGAQLGNESLFHAISSSSGSEQNAGHVQLALRHGCNVFARDEDGMNVFHRCTYEVAYRALGIIISHLEQILPDADYLSTIQAMLNEQDTEGNTPLHIATDHDSLKHLTLLLGFAPNLELSNCYGNTPLSAAVLRQNLLAARLLIDAGADIHRASDCGHGTVLHAAVSAFSTDSSDAKSTILARLLSFPELKSSRIINSPNRKGQSILHLAASSGNLSAVETILALRAGGVFVDVDLVDHKGRTPYDCADEAEEQEEDKENEWRCREVSGNLGVIRSVLKRVGEGGG